jgi:hypothetical protein
MPHPNNKVISALFKALAMKCVTPSGRKYFALRILHCHLNKTAWCSCDIYVVAIFPILPITVAVRSKAWTAFARTKAGIVGSDPTQGMDVYVRLFCVCVVQYVGSGLAMGWSHVQSVLPTVCKIKNWKSGQGPTKDSTAIDR